MRKILQRMKVFGLGLSRSKSIIILLVGIIVGTIMITPASAHLGDSALHIWNDHIKGWSKQIFYTKAQSDDKYAVKGTLRTAGAINYAGNPVDWSKLKGVPAEIADGLDDDGKYAQTVVVAKSGGDYTDPITAMNSITDAAADNPYLLYIAPGVYDLGAFVSTSAFSMKPFVDVKGAGQNATVLTSQSLGSWPAVPGTVNLSDNSVISDMTIKNEGSGTRKAGVVSNSNDKTAVMHDVKVEASGESDCDGIFIMSSSPTIYNANVETSGTALNYGIFIGFAGTDGPGFSNVTSIAKDGSENNGINVIYSSNTDIRGVNAVAEGSAGSNCGIRVYGCTNLSFFDSVGNASGATTNFGLASYSDSTVNVIASELSGNTDAIFHTNTTATSLIMTGGTIAGSVDSTDGRSKFSGVFRVSPRGWVGTNGE